jgi:hypothetical protein
MPSWSVVIVFAVLASCAAVVIAGYVRGNRKIWQAASAKPAAAPAGQPPVRARPAPAERGENAEPHTESWIWG